MGVEGYVESGGLNHNEDGMENCIKYTLRTSLDWQLKKAIRCVVTALYNNVTMNTNDSPTLNGLSVRIQT